MDAESARRPAVDFATLADEALLECIAGGQGDALKALYDRYSRKVFGLALHSVSDHETAEEITIDVFMEVWKNASRYASDRARVSTWILSICRYRAIDALRRRSSRPDRRAVGWDQLPASDHPAYPEQPQETIERKLQQERVREAIAHLPPEQSNALSLAYFKGYTHRQIAAILNLPIGTVKTRIRLAMQKLRLALDDEGKE